MMFRSRKILTSVALLFAGLVIPVANAQKILGPDKAVHVTGLEGVKENVQGTLHVEKGQLHFVHAEGSSDVSAPDILDVITGTDNQATLGKTAYVMSMAAPYGSGRFLCLFRKKIDTLTVQYRDTNGGLHGAIFLMSAGTANAIKDELLAQGAHNRPVAKRNESRTPSSADSRKDRKQ
ncbi:MAG TPA: hypothetical protein VGZ48_14050 [Candidatus Acidoferrales bacterium]|jgi:hypothetical protein|nr:hypothetical protein [Candidatus Acidoferrales bacterium]